MTPKKLSAKRRTELLKWSSIHLGDNASVVSECLSHIAAVEAERDDAIQVRVGYDRKFTAGVFLKTKEYTDMLAERDALRAERDALAEWHEANLKRWEVADGEFIIDREWKLRNKLFVALNRIVKLRAAWLEWLQHRDEFAFAELKRTFAQDDVDAEKP